MIIEFENEAVQVNREGDFFLSVSKNQGIYASLMRVWLEVGNGKYPVKSHDLTTTLIVDLPTGLIDEANIKEGDFITGKLHFKDYRSPRIPIDVSKALQNENLDINVLNVPQRRQALLFIAEAKTESIRNDRIQALVLACKQSV